MWFWRAAALAEEKRLAHERALAAEVGTGAGTGGASSPVVVALAWAAVGIPLAWGVWRTLQSVSKFFN